MVIRERESGDWQRRQVGGGGYSAAALKKCAVTDSILHYSSSISNPVCSHEWIVAYPSINQNLVGCDRSLVARAI